jgi:hypothetical protein
MPGRFPGSESRFFLVILAMFDISWQKSGRNEELGFSNNPKS